MNVNVFTVFATANKAQWISWYEYPHMHKAVGKLQENAFEILILLNRPLTSPHRLTHPPLAPKAASLGEGSMKEGQQVCGGGNENRLLLRFGSPTKHCWCYFRGRWC